MSFTQVAVASSIVCNSVCYNTEDTAVDVACKCKFCNQLLGDWHMYVRQIERSPRKLPKIAYMHLECYDAHRVPALLTCSDSNHRSCTYHLERLGLPDGRTLLIVSDADSNVGMSITNNVERVMAAAAASCRLLDLDRVVFVEHYPEKPGRRTPTYDLVTFGTVARIPGQLMPVNRLNDPAWRRMGVEDWKQLGLPAR